MNKYKHYINIAILLCIAIILSSCKKEAGEGGRAKIYGKVYVKDYNSTFTVLNGEYYGPDVDVYIIYGDNRSYGERVRTSYDGTYEFSNLRLGEYQVYVYSKDSAGTTESGVVPMIKKIEITKRNEEYQVSDIVIFD